MKQKLLTYILMFAMLLGLPACGNTTESSIQPLLYCRTYAAGRN